jgi:large subunit ribosomal protein L10
MIRTEKQEKVRELTAVLGEAKGICLADFHGMTVASISELRRRCRKANVRVEVAKNTLLRRAATEAGCDVMIPFLKGETALVTSAEDQIAPARVLTDFQREFKGSPRVKGGVIEGRAFSETGVLAVANLPPREVLLGQLLRALQGGLTNFVSVMQAPLRNLAHALDQVARQKG